MRAGPSHEELMELLGAYALDAVSEEEAAAIDAHIRTCPRCAQEVDELREVAGALGSHGESAPDGLWDRIAEQLQEAPPELDLERMGSVIPIGQAPARRRRWSAGMRAAVAVAAAVVVVALGGLGAEVTRLRGQVDDLADRPPGVLPLQGDAIAVTMRSPDRSLVVPAVMTPDGAGLVLGGTLPPLGSDETYQLWAIVDGRRISIGVLGSSFEVGPFHAEPGMDAIAITREPAPGVSTSERPPVVLAPVRTA